MNMKFLKAIQQMLEIADETEAAVLKAVFRDEKDRPISGIIVLKGSKEENAEVLTAIEAVEARWHPTHQTITQQYPPKA